MLWWMAGAQAFMMQFSAWTFTGAASAAYSNGLRMLSVFWGNALGLLVLLLFLNISSYSAEEWRGFAEPVPYSCGAAADEGASTFLFRDFNQDGFVDVLTDGIIYGQSAMGDFVDKFAICINRGDGSFLSPAVYSKGSVHRIVSDAADYNNDGYMDLLLLDFWSNAFLQQNGRANMGFTSGTGYSTDTHGGTTRFHDFDQDGDLDIMSVSGGSGVALRIHFFKNTGGKFVRQSTTYGFSDPNESGAFIFYNNVVLADLNGDEKTDIFVRGEYSARALTLIQNGSGFTFDQSSFPLNRLPVWTDLQDFNDDGFPDLTYGEGGNLFVFLNDGDGTFPYDPSLTIDLGFVGGRSLLRDVDHDGDTDVVTRSETYTQQSSVATCLNDGSNNFQVAWEHHFDDGYFIDYHGYNGFALHDLNADGFLDIVTIGRSNVMYVALSLNSLDYASWAAGFSELSDASPTADPDGDLLVTGYEYILGTDPTTAVQPPGFAGLRIHEDLQSKALLVTWRQRSGGTGISGVNYVWQDATIFLEVTTSLLHDTWHSTEEVATISTNSNGDDTETVTVRFMGPLSIEDKIYTRLRIVID